VLTLMLIYTGIIPVHKHTVSADSVDFTDCHRGRVKNITISGCERSKKCVVKNNRNLSAVIEFVPSRRISLLNVWQKMTDFVFFLLTL